MCKEKCAPDMSDMVMPRFKMSKAERAELPGKELTTMQLATATPEQYEQHRLFRRAYERLIRAWKKEHGGDYLKVYQARYHLNYQKNHPEKLTEYIRGYMRDNPEWVERSIERRKLRKEMAKSEKYTAEDVLAKWGTDCYLCGEAIDTTLRRSFKDKSEGWEMALSLDHVVPLSYGGSDTVDNVKPTHTKCNIAKGTSVPEGALTDEHIAAKVLFEQTHGQRKAGRPLKD